MPERYVVTELGLMWWDMYTVNRLRVSEVGSKGEVVHFNEIQVRIECRAVVFPCGIVNGLSQSDSLLPEKALTCPRLLKRLPGVHRGRNHFLGAPSGSRGGMKDDMTISGMY